MTKETLDFLHRTYITVAENPRMSNIIDILQEMLDLLSEFDVPEEDQGEFDVFLRNVENSLRTRKKTFQMTNMVSDVVFAMMYIAIWANNEKGLDIDIDIIARRKSLESELTKLLEKDELHDIFGIRGIILNNDSEEENIQKIVIFSKFVHNILTKSNRKDLKDFVQWIKSLDPYTQERITQLLNIPFRVYRVKDYISNPKDNGYQSLHFILISEMYSEVLPGAEFEVQLRTLEMHRHAVSGGSNHQLYKSTVDDGIKGVFKIEDFAKVNIVGFTSYSSVDDDVDGIHYAKQLVNRRVSNHLCV